MYGGEYTTITLRNARTVTTADVEQELAVRVNGVMYTAVASGSGASCWSPRDNMAGTAAPAVTDDLDLGYKVGSYWYDTTNDIAYVCIDATDGAAVWRQISISQVGTLTSGAWSGAGVAGTNVASIGNVTGRYVRIGARVFCSGTVLTVDPTAGAPTATDFELPLPVASNFAAVTDASGTAIGSVFDAGIISGSIANDRLVVAGSFTANTTISIYVNAAYDVI